MFRSNLYKKCSKKVSYYRITELHYNPIFAQKPKKLSNFDSLTKPALKYTFQTVFQINR